MSGPSIRVAVCIRTGRGGVDVEAVDGCLQALDAAGVGEPLVISGKPGHGLAQARNTALARCDADVIAYVEDDVHVGAGWLQALRAEWAVAGADVGCIGGPLRLRLTGRRPAWLGDDLLPAFGTCDLGGAAREIDPCVQTLLGGSLSFRTSALRGVGGFWPARGDSEARDWFTEEHHAQRELSRVGWRAAYVPGACAERVVAADTLRLRDVMTRRAHIGARRALIGTPRPASAAALGTAKGAAGSMLAAATGRPARAAERAGRAAEHAGALAAPRLAQRDLEPVTDHTPFRHTVPMPMPGGAEQAPPAGGPAVLCYHRVAQLERDPLGLSVSPGHFRSQLEVLRAARKIVPLAAITDGTAPADAVALTFDDGYADNLHNALPLLEEFGAPAAFFIATAHVADGRGFWWDELDDLLAGDGGRGMLSITLAGQERAWAPRDAQQREAARGHLHAWLQPQAPEDIDHALEGVRRWARRPAAVPVHAPEDRPLTVDELRRLSASPLVTIGAHTRTHPSLRFADPARRRQELAGSREDLALWTGVVPDALTYPFGVPGVDVDDDVAEAARACGFRSAFVIGSHPARDPRLAPMLRPRIYAPDVDGHALLALVDGRSRAAAAAASS